MKALRVYYIVPLTMLAVAAVGAHAAKRVQVQILYPAQKSAIVKGSKLAVVPFRESFQGSWPTRNWSVAEAEVTSALTNISLNGDPYFTLTDREALGDVINEQDLARSRRFDPAAAPRIGKLLGASHIVYGTTDYSYRSAYQSQQFRYRSDCGAKKCPRVMVSVSCEIVDIGVSFYPKIVSTSTGQITYAETIKRNVSINACLQPYFSPRSTRRASVTVNPRTVVTNMIGDATRSFTRDIAPYYANTTLLISTKTKLKDKAAKKQFTFAKKLLKSDVREACKIWKSINTDLQSAPQKLDVATRYNTGICHEISGDLQRARLIYMDLKQHLISNAALPPKHLSQAIGRIEKRISDGNQLQHQR